MFKDSEYHIAIRESMEDLATISNSIFLGQQVASENCYGFLKNIDINKRLEMPVAEELQLGMSIGMALIGFLPISIFQRIDFLPRAMDQLVNHLNILAELSRGLYIPKIIIFTTIGLPNTGLQHNKDLIPLIKMAVDLPVLIPLTSKEVKESYMLAKEINTSIIIITKQELYNE